jgi:N-acetylmuramoyl-L-alanine amidase
MRTINLIVIHCTATREGQFVNAAEINRWHKAKGWAGIGYHHVIQLDGAHVEGHNANSIGVVYVGGVAANGQTPKDTRTPDQKLALASLVKTLKVKYPRARVCGHRDLSPDLNHDGKITSNEWMKACPSFDVAAWLKEIGL